MQIVFLVKSNSVNMYSCKDNTYNLLGVQEITYIEKENHVDYENRMVYVVKDICQDFLSTDTYKQNIKNIKDIKIILTNPWCIYEIMNIEKKLEKPIKISQKFIDNLIVHKEIENVLILKNSIYSVSLNGYNVRSVNNQIVNNVNVQYLSIYTSENFINRLKKTLNTIFHLHNIQIDSIYSHINENNKIDINENQLKIIVEDQGVDISYIYKGKNIATLFIKSACVNLKNKIKEVFHIDTNVLDKILKSKSLNLSSDKTNVIYDKNISNIWLDLDEQSRLKIDSILNTELDTVKKQIRDFIDSIENELIQKNTNIVLYCLDEDVMNTIGLIFIDSIKKDAYILDKLLTTESNVFTKKIF